MEYFAPQKERRTQVMKKRVSYGWTLLGCLATASAFAGAPKYEVGKTYWISFSDTVLNSNPCLRDKSGKLACPDSTPLKVRVYGINRRTSIPLIEVLNGLNAGKKNSCYENQNLSDPQQHCDDNSSELTEFAQEAVQSLPTLYPQGSERQGVVKFAVSEGTIAEKPIDYTCARLRMADSGTNDPTKDFTLGQDLRNTKVFHYAGDNISGFKPGWVNRIFRTDLEVNKCGIHNGDRLKIYGEETLAGKEFYIVRIFNADGSNQSKSDLYLYLSKKEVRITR
jgi:hypothetical protein